MLPKPDREQARPMQKIVFDSRELPETLEDRRRFSLWRDVFLSGHAGLDLSPLADQPFQARYEGGQLGAFAIAQFTGTIELLRADGGCVTVEFAGHPEVVTGRQLVLAVALRTTRGGRLRDDSIPAAERPDLSAREVDVVKLLALGYSGPEVAEELRIAHNTVRTHTRNAMTKVGARSRAQLVAMSLAECLYWPDPF